MHILYLQQLLMMPGSPGNHRSWDMALYWKQAGHEVSFITSYALLPDKQQLKAEQSFPYTFEQEGIQIYVLDVDYAHQMPFPLRIRSFISFYQKALRLGKSIQGIDVILAYSAPLSTGELGRKLSIYHQKSFVFETADVWPDVPIGMGIIRNRFLIDWLNRRTQKIYDRANRICCFSEGMKEQIVRHAVSPHKVSVVHNGVKAADIPFISRPISRPGGCVHIIYTGTLGVANKLSQLVEAIHLIESGGRTDIRCTIVGDGNDAKQVQDAIDRYKPKQLIWLPTVSREAIPDLLASADMGIVSFAPFPVLEANGATKFFDYLASGLPIVINYQGWQAEYLASYQCGLSAEQGDLEAFAQHILRLADDPQLRTQMGINGRNLIEEKFDRQDLAKRMLEIMVKATNE